MTTRSVLRGTSEGRGQFQPEGTAALSPAAFHILLSLMDGERHGYAIGQRIAAWTAGSVRVAPGTLYRALDRMCADGWVAMADDGRLWNRHPLRRYRLTARGRDVARAEATRLQDLAAALRMLPALLPVDPMEGSLT